MLCAFMFIIFSGKLFLKEKVWSWWFLGEVRSERSQILVFFGGECCLESAAVSYFRYLLPLEEKTITVRPNSSLDFQGNFGQVVMYNGLGPIMVSLFPYDHIVQSCHTRIGAWVNRLSNQP